MLVEKVVDADDLYWQFVVIHELAQLFFAVRARGSNDLRPAGANLLRFGFTSYLHPELMNFIQRDQTSPTTAAVIFPSMWLHFAKVVHKAAQQLTRLLYDPA